MLQRSVQPRCTPGSVSWLLRPAPCHAPACFRARRPHSQRRHGAAWTMHADAASAPQPSDHVESHIYPPIPSDSSASFAYTALQTSSQDDPLDSADVAVDDGGSSGADPKGPRIPQRWRVVIAIGVAFVLCNMDKVNMSVAVLPMSKDLGWTAVERGLVSSAFFYGYALTQIPAGWISTKIGGAKVLLAGVAIWSIGTLLAPPAAKMGILALSATRVLVGLGEGFAPSAATNVLARLVPERERARAVTVVFGSLDVGSAVGLIVCGPLIAVAGWPAVFYLFAVLGLLWCLAWPFIKPDSHDPTLPVAEPAHVSQPSDETPGALPWGKFLQSSAVWAVTCAHFCFNYGYYCLLAWLPSYFQMALDLNVESSSLLTLIPYLAMIATTPFVGPVADGLAQKGWSLTRVRKLCQGIAFAGPLACMLACAMITPGPGAVTSWHIYSIVSILSVSFAFGSFSRAGLYCIHQDMNPGYASALLGITNTAGALPGILGVSAVGFLLDKSGSWSMALFLPIAGCYLLGLIVFSIFASSERREFK